MIDGLPVELPVIVWEVELLEDIEGDPDPLTDPVLEILTVALPVIVWEVETDPVTV